MLEKFETKSDRVKGLSFHPTRPWILAGLHNGVIQIWNYEMKSLVDSYTEHNGAVRGVHFHQTMPMFVSGGNDQLVRVWNYKQKKCLFRLEGHRDYIRTVFFHHEYPWILSASDDFVIRFWNWQSRSHLTTLSGHLNYVFCAQFHPTEDLVLSASVDQTIRVWDISGLREKQTRNQGSRAPPGSSRESPELFGSVDVQCKHELTGHAHGVNWAAFHPSMKQIVSVADDYHVKLWRLNEMSAGEIDTCRGHTNRVNSCLFHPSQDVLLTCGMDKTIKVWDLHKRVCLETIKRDSAFWTLVAHSKGNLFAAGHDSGLIVFKLERERPAFVRHQNMIFYVKERYVRRYNMETSQDVPLVTVRRTKYLCSAVTIDYNPAEHAVVLAMPGDGGEYEVYKLPKDQNAAIPQPPIRGVGRSGVWISRNRFAVLDGKGNILVKNLKNETAKTIASPLTLPTRMHSVALGLLLLASEASVAMFDLQQRTVLGEASVGRVKHVVANHNGSVLALLSKRMVTLVDKHMKILCQVPEKVNVKSGAFDDSGVFVYNTLNHVKYILPNGDFGIIRTLDFVIYIMKIKSDRIFCVNRKGQMLVMNVVTTEFKFKLALVQKRFDDVLQIVRNSHLPGSAIISYLQRKGYSEVALYRVTDDHTRFVLAKECGKLDIALEAAEALDKAVLWDSLAKLAMQQGNHEVVEKCYFKSKNYNALLHLYIVTGNRASLRKMLAFNSSRGDASGAYMAALLLGDAGQRHKVLTQTGQQALAYYTAKTTGNAELAHQQLEKLGMEQDVVQPVPTPSLIHPPTPVNHTPSAWPLLEISRGFFDQVPGAARPTDGAEQRIPFDKDAEDEAAQAWGDDDGDDLSGDVSGEKKAGDDAGDADDGDAWGGDTDDLDDMDMDMDPSAGGGSAPDRGRFTMPTQGTSQDEVWVHNSKVPGVHVAAGSFGSAMKLMSRQCGVTVFAPFKEAFLHIMAAAHTYHVGAPLTGSLITNVHRNWEAAGARGGLPISPVSLDALSRRLEGGFRLVTKNKIDEAVAELRSVLHLVVLLVVSTPQEVEHALQIRDTCRNYITGLTMLKLARAQPDTEIKRKCELAAYVTHSGLRPSHELLVLQFAATTNFKAKNYKTSRGMCRRLLNLGPKPDVAESFRKRLNMCERAPHDAMQLEYDEYNPFMMCCKSFTPIYKGFDMEVSRLSRASYLPKYAGEICAVDQVSTIGKAGGGDLIICDHQLKK